MVANGTNNGGSGTFICKIQNCIFTVRKIYSFGKELFPIISGKTIIIRNVTVRAITTNLDELDHIGFFIDGNIQYNSTEHPFEWDMNKNYFKGLIEYHRIRVTAFYKGGCEWSDERAVTYIHLL